jgi:hypothetical protein
MTVQVLKNDTRINVHHTLKDTLKLKILNNLMLEHLELPEPAQEP